MGKKIVTKKRPVTRRKLEEQDRKAASAFCTCGGTCHASDADEPDDEVTADVPMTDLEKELLACGEFQPCFFTHRIQEETLDGL